MKPYGRIKNVAGFIGKRSNFKVNNWWEEITQPVKNKIARLKAKQELKNIGGKHQ